MGLVPPEPGQVIRMDNAAVDSGAPVVASVEPVILLGQ
jgi:hypothetical protein